MDGLEPGGPDRCPLVGIERGRSGHRGHDHPAPTGGERGHHAMKKLAVLLVEDDEVLGRSMVQRLGLEGFSVNWTRTAARASEALKTTKPDVIVCDIRLPD